MEQEELSKMPLVEIFTEMTKLEQSVNMDIVKYNRYVKEVVKRFPPLSEREEFQEKELKDEKDKRKEFKII